MPILFYSAKIETPHFWWGGRVGVRCEEEYQSIHNLLIYWSTVSGLLDKMGNIIAEKVFPKPPSMAAMERK
jgi:hypothetical protein